MKKEKNIKTEKKESGPKVFLLDRKSIVPETIFGIGFVLFILGILDVDFSLNIPNSTWITMTNLLVDIGVFIMLFIGVFLFKSIIGPLKELKWGRKLAVTGIIISFVAPFLFLASSIVWGICETYAADGDLEKYMMWTHIASATKSVLLFLTFGGFMLCTIAIRRNRFVIQSDAENSKSPKEFEKNAVSNDTTTETIIPKSNITENDGGGNP